MNAVFEERKPSEYIKHLSNITIVPKWINRLSKRWVVCFGVDLVWGRPAHVVRDF